MNTPDRIEKKPYRAPTVIRHGDAVEQTRGGIIGPYTEWWGWTRDPFKPTPGF